MKTYVGAHPELAAFGAWASSAPWTGTSPARQVLKARILLKADASEAGEAWSDGQIAEALDTSIDTIARTRQQLVEEGLDAALIRKRSPNSARKRIFRRCCRGQVDRAACSPPPKGRKRWTLVVTQAPVLSPAASAARGIWRADPDRRQRALMVRGQISVFGNSPRSSCWATTLEGSAEHAQTSRSTLSTQASPTDLNDRRGYQTVSQGAAIAWHYSDSGPTSGFFSVNRQEPW